MPKSPAGKKVTAPLPAGAKGFTASGRPIPLSEDQRKFRNWTKQECIEHLRTMALANPDQVITRNFFRVHSEISERTWNRHFGTFLEFKRQADIMLSRHAHRLERNIAKHASVDIQRITNAEKADWASNYLRPVSRRFQTALVCSDLHDLHCDPFYRRVLIDTARRVQPEKIVLNGDIFDMPEFSKHFQDPREFKLLDRLAWVHALLADLRNACPNAEIIFVEGNHEFRLLRHMSEQTPAMMVVLADLHGFTVPTLLKLTEYEVNFIARADLTAWTERDIKAQLRNNYVVCWDALLFGHFPEMRAMGYPGASGHHHKHIVWTAYSPTFGPHEWHQIGAGHRREASYCPGEKWANGFLLAHCDTHTRRTQMEYLDLSHPHAFVGGQFYARTDDEPVPDLNR